MTSPAHAVVQHRRNQGVVLEAARDRIRVDAPKGVISPELRKKLIELKPEILSELTAERSITGLSLEGFRASDWQIELRVDWLDETIFWVPTAEAAHRLVETGIPRGRIWTANELIDLSRIPDLSKNEIRSLGRLKARLGLEIISTELTADEPR